ncbi:alkene reductase [Sulfuriferula plumbiphila]|uniref:Alkene reductase n=1 Tax=Sulfuriferula plumbiphila TaxID=171865 RepID=A0A512L731_9PROT|nr:alkene reductase [Sulfuriferula plumbiphila]BBP02847.1 alkene reductase [Sulfuriferula plumbiphila]GEP30286.1 alkene reductase [Sulfuriferula plumbiphila]
MTTQHNSNTHASTLTDLFQPYAMGPLTLANRIVMAPLTRSRALAGDVPGPLAVTYYTQRASAGLIISEASQISQQGKGYAQTPGIYSAAQVAGWRKVTDAVHAAGGKIFIQLWHVGRISHPEFQPGGALPVAPSAIRPAGTVHTSKGKEDMVTPRALETAEIPGIVADYRKAAQNAYDAGFDGVEIHAANGYLLDQFMRDKTNQRSDVYGGSIENRSRLLLEVTDAVLSIWSADRVGVRLSPLSTFSDIDDSNPAPLFSYVVRQLALRNLGYLHMIEGNTGGPRETGRDLDFKDLRQLFPNTYLANNCYTREMALTARGNNTADLIAFGRPFISNPDLVERLRRNAPLNELDPATLYGGGEHGYTDYPFLDHTRA